MKTKHVNPSTRPTDLMPMRKALEELAIKPSTFFVAAKRHAYLKDAIVREVHPDTGAMWTQISRAAVERYANERRAGGDGGGSHPGQIKYAVFLSDAELATATELLTKAFGRDVAITRLYRAKADANGTEPEADAEPETNDAE